MSRISKNVPGDLNYSPSLSLSLSIGSLSFIKYHKILFFFFLICFILINCRFQFAKELILFLFCFFFSVGVFCVSEGWTSSTNDEFVFTYASIYIQAWIFGSSDIVFTQTDTRGSGIAVSPTIAMPRSFNIDTHLFLVRVSYQENI